MKILIADDDPVTRRLLTAMLGEWGHQVISADEGEAAWQILNSPGAPSLAILDWTMPKLSGIDVCRRVRGQLHSKTIYLLLLTARSDAAEISEGLSSGADDYLTKPFNQEELRARIRNGERIIELQRNLQSRVGELDTALTALETAEDDLHRARTRQMLLESAIEQTDLTEIISNAEQSDVSILITDAALDAPGPEIVFVNAAFTRMTGYEIADLRGESPRILQGAETDFAVLKRLRRALEKGERFFGETVNYRKDGTTYNLEWHISPIKNQAGKVSNFVSVQRDVTARKEVEAMLRESREYRNLFHLANDSILIFDPETELVLKVNDKACENYRIGAQNFVGMSLKYISLDRQHDAAMMDKLFTDGASEEFETIHLRGDGSPMNVLINSSFVQFKGKQAVLSINRDITERRRSETKIKLAKQEWSDTVDAISDLILLENSAGEIIRCNQAARQFFDLSYAAIIDQPLMELLHLRAEDQADALRVETWEGKIGADEKWYEITNHEVPAASFQGWVHIVKDISARKNSESALRRLNTAIEQAADGILILDDKGAIQYVNPAFERISGHQAADIINEPFFRLRAGVQADGNSAQSLSIIARGEVWHGVYKATRTNGEVYDEDASISPVRGSDGKLVNYVVVCRDVTEQRRLESIAEAVNMMENVGFIFAGIRHELGNPINSIKTALTVLQKNQNVWQPAQIATYIERCLSETKRVEYLLRALKTFSMHENPRMQSVGLNAFMQSFVALVAGDFDRRGIAIEFDAQANDCHARCDPRALHQVMLNLLANAADALAAIAAPRVIITVSRKSSERIRIVVADNGAGMNDTQMTNLFKPFYTSKPDGTGLGLVIVKKMIAKMNGTITIFSQPNVGTEVLMTLETAEIINPS